MEFLQHRLCSPVASLPSNTVSTPAVSLADAHSGECFRKWNIAAHDARRVLPGTRGNTFCLWGYREHHRHADMRSRGEIERGGGEVAFSVQPVSHVQHALYLHLQKPK
jgi:hypothetical protein